MVDELELLRKLRAVVTVAMQETQENGEDREGIPSYIMQISDGENINKVLDELDKEFPND
jgi:hypothetical protein